MATQQPQQAAVAALSPATVASTFARQYYAVRHATPGLVYRFYAKDSIVCWPPASDLAAAAPAPRPPGAPAPALEQCSGPTAINAKACALGLEAFATNVRCIDSAPTSDGGVLVLVTGALVRRPADAPPSPGGGGSGGDVATGGASPRALAAARGFAQTFFLAPQESGYFVALDIMRLTAIAPPPAPARPESAAVAMPIAFAELSLADAAAAAAAAAPAAPGTPPQSMGGPGPGRGHVSSGYGGASMMQQQQWGAAVGPHPHGSYDAAYASAMQAEHARAMAAAYGPYAAYYAGGAHPGHMGLPSLRHERGGGGRPRGPMAPSSAIGDDSASIFVRRLPADVSAAELEREFRRFGPLRGGVGGVTLKSSNNRHFAFIEFESRDAAQAAQAAQIELGGRPVEIEAKRPMSSGRGRGRGRGRYTGGYGGGGYLREGDGGVGVVDEGVEGAPEGRGSPPPPPPPPGEAEDSATWPRPSAE